MKIRFTRSLSILFGTLFMMALAILSSTAAFADSPSGSTIVNGAGNVTEAATAPTIPSVTLNGLDQTVNYTLPITVVDATGTGNGWNLTITSTTFSTGGNSPHTLANDASSITGVSSSCAVSGTTCTDTNDNSVSYPLALPAGATAPTAVKFFSTAADSGMGKFTITPTVSLAVPANAYASNSGYSSTITVAVVSGP